MPRLQWPGLVNLLVATLGGVHDVKNEARVHLWYERRFGRHLEPYRSTGDAIATWPTTASSEEKVARWAAQWPQLTVIPW
jgi:hypothetical protein